MEGSAAGPRKRSNGSVGASLGDGDDPAGGLNFGRSGLAHRNGSFWLDNVARGIPGNSLPMLNSKA